MVNLLCVLTVAVVVIMLLFGEMVNSIYHVKLTPMHFGGGKCSFFGKVVQAKIIIKLFFYNKKMSF